MSRDGSIQLDFGGKDRKFRLGIKELIELQEVTSCGPEFLINRFIDGNWKVQNVRQVIRIGLIGGGSDPREAEAICRRYFDEILRLLDNKELAFNILHNALIGPEEDDPGGKPKGRRKRTAKRKANRRSQTEDGDLLNSIRSAGEQE